MELVRTGTMELANVRQSVANILLLCHEYLASCVVAKQSNFNCGTFVIINMIKTGWNCTVVLKTWQCIFDCSCG